MCSYYLRYTLNYTYNYSAIEPLSLGTFTTPDCATFYNVLRNDAQPETVASTEYEVGADAQVLLAIGHQHTGALNISLFLNGKFVCASYPTYGTEEGVAGNEKGYLVGMSHCIDDSTGPLLLNKGDKLRLDSWYFVGSNDPRLLYSDGTHMGVMGYMYTAYRVLGGPAAGQDVSPIQRRSFSF